MSDSGGTHSFSALAKSTICRAEMGSSKVSSDGEPICMGLKSCGGVLSWCVQVQEMQAVVEVRSPVKMQKNNGAETEGKCDSPRM